MLHRTLPSVVAKRRESRARRVEMTNDRCAKSGQRERSDARMRLKAVSDDDDRRITNGAPFAKPDSLSGAARTPHSW